MALWIVISFVVGMGGAFLVAQHGLDWGFVDSPTERSSHRVPVPKGGGIGILVVFIAGAMWWHIPWTLWVPVCIVSLVSLLTDYRDLSFKIRLAVQIGSAAVFSGSLFLLKLPASLPRQAVILVFVLGMLYIAATSNYYNFMDGINGIAGVTGIIAFSFLGLFGLTEGRDIAWVVSAFGIAAACAGFLPLNFPRARVFMGDVGSVLLGYLFAAWVLSFSHSIHEFIVLASFLFPFYADEVSTLIVRIRDGDKLTQAHRRHIYQILANQAGLSHASVTLLYGSIQVGVAALTWLVMRYSMIWLITLFGLLSAMFFLGGLYIRSRWEIRLY